MSFIDEFDATSAPAKAPGKPEPEPRSFSESFDSVPARGVVKAAPTTTSAVGQAEKAALAGADMADEVSRSMVQNLGASIIAGWRGIATLATTGDLKLAADAVDEEMNYRGYQAENPTVQKALTSPWNPLNWVGKAAKFAGEASQDVMGMSPGVATTVETGINALPLLLMRAGNVEEGAAAVKAPNVKVRFGQPQGVQEGEIASALPAEEQLRRAQLLQRVGLEGEVRKSAIAGDAKAAATDFQQSKLDNPGGSLMKAKLDAERAALTRHAESIVEDTGGTTGSDSSVAYARGQAILDPLDKLNDYFNARIKGLYQQADAKAGGMRIATPRLHEYLGGDQADFLATEEGSALLRGVQARMKTLGIQEGGENAGATVASAERLKQFLNNNWQPRTARLIRNIKNAIDDDVTQSAGEDIYAQARALRHMRAVTLDEPNGIGKIMDASGPEGINRAVPVEKVADTISGMPVDQFAHVVRTLQAAPEEIQPAAQTALSEIKANFAQHVLDAGTGRVGQWGARDVSRLIRNHQARMEIVFSKAELAKLGDLEEAGRILRTDQAYPGAAVQEHNLVARGAMEGVRAGATLLGETAGSAVGLPGIGAGAGSIAGGKLAGKMAKFSSLRAAQRRFVNLNEIGR